VAIKFLKFISIQRIFLGAEFTANKGNEQIELGSSDTI